MNGTLGKVGRLMAMMLAGAALLIGTLVTSDWPISARARGLHGSHCSRTSGGYRIGIGPLQIEIAP